MYKIFGISAIALFIFSGCVQTDIPLTELPNMSHTYDVDDVDMSDLDENLTETELIMTEEGEESKLARIEFPVSEYYGLSRSGRGTIKGTIYVKDLYGDSVFGAGTRLYLNPITSYSKQWYVESYLGGHQMQKADARLFNYLRFTASNTKGEFAFYGVPSGSYYLIGTVKCANECGYSSLKSIRITKKVTVHGNQIVVKDLTQITN